MRTIFISYRRNDAEGETGRLFDDLVSHFGEGSVFMDVVAIDIGRDFRKAIDESVATCGVLLAIIGKDWIDAEDEGGHRRLEDPNDFVRLETASALKRDIPVIPVLVRGAKMPRAEQLPDDLKELAYRNGVELTHARWASDIQLLINGLRSCVEGPEKATDYQNKTEIRHISWWKSRTAIFASLLTAFVAVIIAAYTFWPMRTTVPDVTGATLADATTKIEAAHLQPGTVSRQTRPNVAKNIVLDEYPKPGKKVDPGSTVDLVVSEEPASPPQTASPKAAPNTAAPPAGGGKIREPLPPNQGSPTSVSVTISEATCSVIAPGTFRIEMDGWANVPAGQTYLFYAEESGPAGGTRWRPMCKLWRAAESSDGTLWSASCVHRPNDPTRTEWQAITVVKPQDGQPPTSVYGGTILGASKSGGTAKSLNCVPQG